MFTISYGDEETLVGTVGYWKKIWNQAEIYEAGWQVFSEYSGRGIATAAEALIIAKLRTNPERRALHAFPSIENVASNRVCERAGFVNSGMCQFEYPRGYYMDAFDWRYDFNQDVEKSALA